MSAEVSTTSSLAECATDLSALNPATSWPQWADRISATWQKAIEPIVQTGRLLIEAKADLPHGAFETMVQSKLPFAPSTAQRLMAIARHPVISNPVHVQLLPPSWGTLYELTKLPLPLLEAKIKDGTISPKLERKDAAKLRGEDRYELTVNGQPIEHGPTLPSPKAELLMLREENRRLKQMLDGEHLFDPKRTTDAEIVDAMIGRLEGWRGRAERIARLILKKIEQSKATAERSCAVK